MIRRVIIVCCILILYHVQNVHSMNMVVKPNVNQAPANGQVSPRVLPVPTPPTPPPTLAQQPMVQQQAPADKSITIINATPFAMAISYKTSTNPLIVESIGDNKSKTISYKADGTIMYSFEGVASKPITSDMISNGSVTIKTPPELIPQPSPTAQQQAPPTTAIPPVITVPAIPVTPISSAKAVPIPQLPAAASSSGPPGYKAERPTITDNTQR